jgi:hypothetical protein
MSFSTTTDLMLHQEPAVAKLLPTRVGGLFMDPGLGKSRTVIELAKLRAGKWDRFFWFCPCALKETVRHELLKHTDLTGNQIYVFGDDTTPETAPADRLFYVIGIESMAAAPRVVLAFNALVTDRSFVAVDESSYIKGHRAIRTLRITGMSERSRYRAVLTGTPFTQGVVDMYAQMRFLSQKILGYASFYSFAANHLEYEEIKVNGQWRKTGRIIRSHNTDYLAAKIAPYVYQVRQEECLSLPERLYESKYFTMTSAQRELYETAKEEILLSEEFEEWSPIRIFRAFGACQTIACGFWNRRDPLTGERETITAPHRRIELLMATLGGIPECEKVIIWANCRRSIAEICAALVAKYGPDAVAELHGGVNEAQREASVSAWRQASGPRFLVASQGIGGHGWTLNEAAYVIVYKQGYKSSERIQMERRNHRIGQGRSPVYITLLCCESIDMRIAGALAGKENALRAFQTAVNKCRNEGLRKKALEMVRAL